MNRKGSQPEQQQPKCNVKVCVRTRPLSDGERAAGGSSIVKYDGKSIVCKGKTYGQFDEVGRLFFTYSLFLGVRSVLLPKSHL